MLTTQVHPHPWLSRFPPETHSTVEAWVRHSLTRSGGEPAAMLRAMAVLVGHALDWAATAARRELCTQVLLALRTDQAGALAYAQRLGDGRGARRG